MKRRIMAVLTAMLLLISAVPVYGAAADTAKVRGNDRKLEQVAEMFAAYTTAMNLSGDITGEKTVIPLNDRNRLSIGAFIRYNYKEDYGFTAKELKKETKALFGRASKVGVLKGNRQAEMLVCEAEGDFVREPYMYCGGDFGDCIPQYRIEKVVPLKKNLYKVQIRNQMSIYGESGSENMGTTILKVRKENNSTYGYVVKKVIYRR